MDRSTDRLVYYSIAAGDWDAAREAARQLADSVESLRRHNRHVPVHVLAFGTLPGAVLARLRDLDAIVHEAGSYEEHLASVCPRHMAEVLRLFPLVHKWTSARLLRDLPVSRVLYADCDTVFLGDVDRLFEECRELDLYAREEPFSRRSPLGYRREHVDEDRLADVARRMDSRWITPFNTGVVLMNHGVFRKVAAAAGDFARCVYRLSASFARRPAARVEGPDVSCLRARPELVSAEGAEPIDLPISDDWLKEELALWLTVGKIPGLRQGNMTRDHVLQGREYDLVDLDASAATVVHYFSTNAAHFRDLWRARDAAAPSAPGRGGGAASGGLSFGAMPELAALGDRIEREYRRAGYDETRFSAIALEALVESRVSERVSATSVLEWVLSARDLPRQSNIALDFGQPPVVVYGTPRWYIEVLHWMDGTTTIHQHAFDGAFGVLSGSSLHSTYRFDAEQRYGARLVRGAISKTGSELLRGGDARAIVSGDGLIHSLFHLDRPSVSIVVRTQESPGHAPQYQYETPGLAHDPFFDTELLRRKRQAIRTLGAMGHAGLAALAQRACAEADPLSLVHLAFEVAALPSGTALLPRLLDGARARHGALVDAIVAAAEDRARRARILALRGKLRSADLRFFLALLLQSEHAGEMMALVRARHPDEDPRDLLIGWLAEATGAPDPESPGDKVFGATLDGALSDLARVMLGGASFEECMRALESEYDPEDLRAQREDLESIHQMLVESPYFAPMFRGAPAR